MEDKRAKPLLHSQPLQNNTLSIPLRRGYVESVSGRFPRPAVPPSPPVPIPRIPPVVSPSAAPDWLVPRILCPYWLEKDRLSSTVTLMSFSSDTLLSTALSGQIIYSLWLTFELPTLIGQNFSGWNIYISSNVVVQSYMWSRFFWIWSQSSSVKIHLKTLVSFPNR